MNEIDPLFSFQPLNSEGINKAKAISEEFSSLLFSLRLILGDPSSSREFSIAKTKLEEAAFFVKKAMANQSENQKNQEPLKAVESTTTYRRNSDGTGCVVVGESTTYERAARL